MPLHEYKMSKKNQKTKKESVNQCFYSALGCDIQQLVHKVDIMPEARLFVCAV
jgi:hypothetical protein